MRRRLRLRFVIIYISVSEFPRGAQFCTSSLSLKDKIGMCLAIPGKIIELNGQLATVDFSGLQKEVNITLLSDAKCGEFVIVHAGFAIEKVEKDVVMDIEGYLK